LFANSQVARCMPTLIVLIICYNSPAMILVTGGTGFIGRVLVRQLALANKEVRLLIRPSSQSLNLPRGVPIDVAICSLKDERGLRAAMKGVDTVYHLVGVESRGNRADLMKIDIEGTRLLLMLLLMPASIGFFISAI